MEQKQTAPLRFVIVLSILFLLAWTALWYYIREARALKEVRVGVVEWYAEAQQSLEETREAIKKDLQESQQEFKNMLKESQQERTDFKRDTQQATDAVEEAYDDSNTE